jgi:hypothetical protein
MRGGLAALLTGLALAGGLVSAAEPVAPRARLERITVRGRPSPAVRLRLSGRAAPEVRELAAQGDSPPRVYVDLRGAVLGPALARVVDGTGPVRRVRAGQFDRETVRVVVELREPRRYDVRHDGAWVTLALKDGRVATEKIEPPTRGEPPAAALPPTETAPASGAPQALVTHPESEVPPEIEDRIARRYAVDDWPDIVALYAVHPAMLRRHGSPTTRAAVVDALRELGLVHSARKVLGPTSTDEPPVLRVARGELALAGRDVAGTAAALASLGETGLDPVTALRLRRLRARIALAEGDFGAAATAIGDRGAPDLRAALAHVALAAGRAASERRACRRALAAYQQALDADGGRTVRAAAGAGLVRTALVCADAGARSTGLGVLAESSHPLLRRAAAALAPPRPWETEQARAEGIRSGGG